MRHTPLFGPVLHVGTTALALWLAVGVAGCGGGAAGTDGPGGDDSDGAETTGQGATTVGSTAGTTDGAESTGGHDTGTGDDTDGGDTGIGVTGDDTDGGGTGNTGDTDGTSDTSDSAGTTDTAGGDIDATLRAVDAAGAPVSVTRTVSVALQIVVASGRLGSVLVANDVTLKANAKTWRLADLVRVDTGIYAITEPWDLDAGLGASADGPRTVYARFTSDAGIESAIVPLKLTLDRKAPMADISISNPKLNATDPVTLTVVFDEALATAPVVQLSQASGAPLTLVNPDVNGNTYAYTIAAAQARPDGVWTVSGSAKDAAGNEGVLLAPDLLTVDATPPAAAQGIKLLSPAPAVDGRFYAKAGTEVAVGFSDNGSVDFDPSVSSVTVGPLQLVPDSGDARTWRATTPAQIDEQTFPVSVRLVDDFGNDTVTAPATPSLTYDLTAPRLVEGGSTISIKPPASSAVTTAAAVTTGSAITVGLWVTEPVLAPPASVWAEKDGSRIDFDVVPTTGSVVTATTVFNGASPAQGGYAVRAELVDFAGNMQTADASFIGAGLVVDTQPPSPPDDGTGAPLIILTATPWGSLASAGATRLSVTGNASAAEAGVTLLFMQSGTAIGQTTARADGSFAEIVLNASPSPTSVSQISVTAFDGAGNRSSVTALKWVNWVATLGKKIAGSTAGNPHGFDSTFAISTGSGIPSGQAVSVTQAGLDSLVALGSPLTQQGALAFWRAPQLTTSPPPRGMAAMAQNPAAGNVMLVGGRPGGTSSLLSDSWTWSGQTWRELSTTTVPTARRSAVLSYVGSSTVMLFGGMDLAGRVMAASSRFASGYWYTSTPSTEPPGLAYATMVFDTYRGEGVLFGGLNAVTGAYSSETWVYNASTWSKASTTGPGARVAASSAYDESTSATILFGGQDLSGNYFSDTWKRSNTGSWSRLTTTYAPSGRSGSTMGYDPIRKAEFLFGGYTASGLTNALYMRTSDGWHLVTPANSVVPPARIWHGMAYDVNHKQFVVFGGCVEQSCVATPLGDTYTLSTGTTDSAGHYFTVDTAYSPVRTVTAVSLVWYTGGVGYPNGVVTSGATVEYWDNVADVWKSAGTTTANPTTPGKVEWTTTLSADLAAVIDTVGKKMLFRARPTVVNGSGVTGVFSQQVGSVSTDYVEVRVTGRTN